MVLVVRRYKKCSSPAEREGNRSLFAVSWLCPVALAAWCSACAPASPPVTAMEADSGASSLIKGCEAGSAADCHALGLMHMSGGDLPGDDGRAVELFGNACNRGNAAGCVNLGRLYRKGRGVTKDDARAAELYRKGCDGGERGGCFGLADAYAEGRGVPRDDTRAEELFRKLCESGKREEESCIRLWHDYGG